MEDAEAAVGAVMTLPSTAAAPIVSHCRRWRLGGKWTGLRWAGRRSRVSMGHMEDREILDRIGKLVDEEHQLEQQHTADGLDEDEQQRLRRVEQSLDQCWDLLRQRRARRNAGLDPDAAETRSKSTVENYRQ